MNRNDSPRLINKLNEIIKEIFCSKNLLEKFTSEFKESLVSDDDHFTPNFHMHENKYYFRGYPNGNLLKLFTKILDLWHIQNYFPILFPKIEGLKDLTNNLVEFLNTHTSNVNLAFTYLKENNSQGAYKTIMNFLDCLGIRGFLTAIGVRVTPGSCENILPKREDLYKSFNIVYQKKNAKNQLDKESNLTDNNNSPNQKNNIKDIEEAKKTAVNESNNINNDYKTKITVGARALSKHADRSKDPFWGSVSGSELDRNEKANELLKKFFDECVWINMHMLPHSSKTLEIRNQNGHGIRWFLNGEFRGFIEPEEVFVKIKDKNKKISKNNQ